jgi:hypothetical protein
LEWVGGSFDSELFEPEKVFFNDPDELRQKGFWKRTVALVSGYFTRITTIGWQDLDLHYFLLSILPLRNVSIGGYPDFTDG